MRARAVSTCLRAGLPVLSWSIAPNGCPPGPKIPGCGPCALHSQEGTMRAPEGDSSG